MEKVTKEIQDTSPNILLSDSADAVIFLCQIVIEVSKHIFSTSVIT